MFTDVYRLIKHPKPFLVPSILVLRTCFSSKPGHMAKLEDATRAVRRTPKLRRRAVARRPGKVPRRCGRHRAAKTNKVKKPVGEKGAMNIKREEILWCLLQVLSNYMCNFKEKAQLDNVSTKLRSLTRVVFLDCHHFGTKRCVWCTRHARTT